MILVDCIRITSMMDIVFKCVTHGASLASFTELCTGEVSTWRLEEHLRVAEAYTSTATLCDT